MRRACIVVVIVFGPLRLIIVISICLCSEECDARHGAYDFYAEQLQRIVAGGPADMTESIEWRVVELVTAAKEPLHVDTVRAFIGCTDNARKRAVARLSTENGQLREALAAAQRDAARAALSDERLRAARRLADRHRA